MASSPGPLPLWFAEVPWHDQSPKAQTRHWPPVAIAAALVTARSPDHDFFPFALAVSPSSKESNAGRGQSWEKVHLQGLHFAVGALLMYKCSASRVLRHRALELFRRGRRFMATKKPKKANRKLGKPKKLGGVKPLRSLSHDDESPKET